MPSADADAIARVTTTTTLTLSVSGAPVIDNQELWDKCVASETILEIDDVGGERCVVVELIKKSSVPECTYI